MEKKEDILCYDRAAACLPSRLRSLAERLPEDQKAQAEELRLRCGQPLSVLLPEGESRPWPERVAASDLEALVNGVTEFSRYAAAESLRNGYLSARGGCRIGLCGTAVMKDGASAGLRELSSAVIRIVREKRGIGEPLVPDLFIHGRFQSTLLLAPPGGGKTTLLRDLVRCLSTGTGCPPQRISLIDERGEVAVMFRGQPQMDVGIRTDILDACPKAVGIPMVLRAMNPQVIAVDEITIRQDILAMTAAANCGVGLLATIHSGSVEELVHKPLYAELLAAKVFRKILRIQCLEGERRYAVEDLPC